MGSTTPPATSSPAPTPSPPPSPSSPSSPSSSSLTTTSPLSSTSLLPSSPLHSPLPVSLESHDQQPQVPSSLSLIETPLNKKLEDDSSDALIKPTALDEQVTTIAESAATAVPAAIESASANKPITTSITIIPTNTTTEEATEPTNIDQSAGPSDLTSATTSDLSVSKLKQLLELREQEIRSLNHELEKYKVALHQKQLELNLSKEQHRQKDLESSASLESKRKATSVDKNSQPHIKETEKTIISQSISAIKNVDLKSDQSDIESKKSDRLARVPSSTEEIHPVSPSVSTSGTIVRFTTGADDDFDDDDDDDETDVDKSKHERISDIQDDLDDIIQDVSEIDLNLELDVDSKSKSPVDKSSSSRHGDIAEDDEDVISDGLLTSLTDAAINNLSQLAALQERCESQQQHSHQQYQPQQQQQQTQQQSDENLLAGNTSSSTSLHHHHQSLTPTTVGGMSQAPASDYVTRDPFGASASSLTSQAAAMAAMSAAVAFSQQQQSSCTSLSPNPTIPADLNPSHSLASVVAAAAAAAAAAATDQPHQHHNLSSLNQATGRLMSSNIQSPEFYHSLHSQHGNAQVHQQHNSPFSSLHFSPSTSITPSPSSLLHSQSSSHRSATSSTPASSSIISPISSPNYLRRQFMPDRLLLLSPSPSSGLATGSSSGASSSLAQLLHQQRSASALAGGPISSSTSTPLGSSTSGTGSTSISPIMNNKNSSQARLNNMQIRHKFGYLGSSRGQFNSPHGFCLGLNQEIVVADTNNHRVCIFDKSGTYITQFGSPGKEEGQLWNPRKVAILHRPTSGIAGVTSVSGGSASGGGGVGSGSSSSVSSSLQTPAHSQSRQQLQLSQASSVYSSHINSSSLQNKGQILGGGEPLYVVCDRGAERSRMQLFTKDGSFIKKIGIHYIDIVAGLAITQNGLIIVVDSVSPTVYIIDGETGVLNGWFDCSGHMKEPSDIAVKSDVPGNEYFICDFKGHCVVVFNGQGEYLRKIGHDGLTSYPNGIDISDDGDILVGDSHGNRFHVVVFDRNGNFVSQFECPHVKVSRCCGLKITREGYIVTLAKNNHHVLVLDTIHI